MSSTWSGRSAERRTGRRAPSRRLHGRAGAGTPLSYLGGGGASFAASVPPIPAAMRAATPAGYFDVAAKVIGNLRLDIAGRYEDYSDFGAARSGKFTARYDFGSGVRAPRHGQQRVPRTDGCRGVLHQDLHVPDFHRRAAGRQRTAAALFGLGNLQPETSVNYSWAWCSRRCPELTGTLDLYHINLDHRIVSTQSFSRKSPTAPTPPASRRPRMRWCHRLSPPMATSSTPRSSRIPSISSPTGSTPPPMASICTLRTSRSSTASARWIGVWLPTTTRLRSLQCARDAGESGRIEPDRAQCHQFLPASPRRSRSTNIQLGGLWTLDRLSVNLAEVVHDTTTSITSVQGNACRPSTIRNQA